MGFVAYGLDQDDVVVVGCLVASVAEFVFVVAGWNIGTM